MHHFEASSSPLPGVRGSEAPGGEQGQVRAALPPDGWRAVPALKITHKARPPLSTAPARQIDLGTATRGQQIHTAPDLAGLDHHAPRTATSTNAGFTLTAGPRHADRRSTASPARLVAQDTHRTPRTSLHARMHAQNTAKRGILWRWLAVN